MDDATSESVDVEGNRGTLGLPFSGREVTRRHILGTSGEEGQYLFRDFGDLLYRWSSFPD